MLFPRSSLLVASWFQTCLLVPDAGRVGGRPQPPACSGWQCHTQGGTFILFFFPPHCVSLKEEKKPPPPVPKKPAKPKPAVSRDKASDAGDKQRQEARKRLLAAKRAASVRQNSATESADSIEIYVPEAQTRL